MSSLVIFPFQWKLRQSSFVNYSVQMENGQMFLQQLCLSGV